MLKIIYQDPHLIAIDKPAGLLVHRSMIDRHETRFAVQMLRDQIGQQVFPVHRLDRGTSGVLLFALDSDTARLLNKAFEAQDVGKTYLAVVRGHPAPSGHIDYALSRQPDEIEFLDPRAQLIAQPAVTDYETLATTTLPVCIEKYPTSRYALVRLTPHTGRRHQLRRHMKHIAHPIIGDATHGKGIHNRYFRDHLACPRLLLACVEMHFKHPHREEEVVLTAPIGDSFLGIVDRFEWASVLPAHWQSRDN